MSGSSFSVSEDGEKTVFRTERVVLEADSKNGGFVWRNADDGRVLLKEGRKELTEAPLMVYSTGGRGACYQKSSDRRRREKFCAESEAVEDHMAFHGKLNFCWQPDEHIHGLGQGEEGIL